jgi:anti-sigma factor RsiW
MTCSHFQADLPGYHFAIIAPDARAALEAHLLACPDCLAAFIAVKRSLELADDAPRPSDAARARLRAAVAAELTRPARAWSWWERPLALTLAAAATVLAFFTVTQLHTRPAGPPHSLVAPR